MGKYLNENLPNTGIKTYQILEWKMDKYLNN